jgi:hypothetical protein
MKKDIKNNDRPGDENLEIFIDFKNDLTLIAHIVNDLVTYSIQNEDILHSNVKNLSFFNDLIQNGDWKRVTNFYKN